MKKIVKKLAFLLFFVVLFFMSSLMINIYNETAFAYDTYLFDKNMTKELEKGVYDNNSIIVVLNTEISDINKKYDCSFFRGIKIEDVEDLTFRSEANSKKNAGFKQILQIKLSHDACTKYAETLSEVRKIPGVYCACPNYQHESMATPNDTFFNMSDFQWGVNSENDIRTQATWDITTGSLNIRVGIIDTGIANHEDLNDNLTTGRDFFNNNNITNDDVHSHGTHVAGIIGAVGNNELGICGVNWRTTIVPLQTINNNGLHFDSDIIKAINWAENTWGTNEQIDVLNISLSGYGDSLTVRSAIQNYHGLVVFAAGNEIRDVDESIAQNGSFNLSNLISVGAIKPNGERWEDSNYSSTGVNVNIYAPGHGIYSTVPTSITPFGYARNSGTSMAAPHVTGVAALMLSVNPNLSASELKTLILNNADDISITIPDGTGGTTTQTVKKLNAYKSVAAALYDINSSGRITGLKADTVFSGVLSIPNSINGIEVTGVANNAFTNNSNITSVILPNTAKYIGQNAFKNCSNLTSIYGVSAITTIGAQAFSGCSSLTGFVVPQSTFSIGNRAFEGCYSMNISVASNNNYFYAVNNILYNKARTRIIGAGNVPAIINIPDTVTIVNSYVFSGNSVIEEVHFESSPNIYLYAFANCTNLSEVYFYSSSLPTLGTNAFLNGSFTLYVPYCVQSDFRTRFAGYTNDVASIPITISFSSNGNILNTLNTYYGAEISNLPNPNSVGYNNMGWYDNSSYTGLPYENGDFWNFRQSVTLFLKQTPKTYYITFSGCGSDGLSDLQVTYDEVVGVMPTASKTGYSFLGWKTQGNVYITADTVWQIDNDETVVSDFLANQYTIYFDGNGGYDSLSNIQVYYDDVVSILPSATRTGHTFSEWRTSPTTNSGIVIQAPLLYQIDDDIILYAHYYANDYAVNFDKQNGNSGVNGVNATYGEPMPTGDGITAPSRIGYSFLGYYESANGVGTKYYNGDMSSAHIWDYAVSTTLYAYWLPNVYSVTLVRQNGSGLTDNVYATFGQSMPSTIPAPSQDGYTFVGYFSQTNGNGVKYYNFDMTSAHEWDVADDTSLYAHWTVNTYTVTLDKQGGIGGANSVEVQYLSTLPMSLSAPTKQGFAFCGYYTAVNGTGDLCYDSQMLSQYVWNNTANGTIYAYWIQNQFEVTLDNGIYGANVVVVATYGSPMPVVDTVPTRSHYLIEGYYDSNNVKYYDGPNMVSVRNWDKHSNDTLHINWIGESYTVSYNNITFGLSTAVVIVGNSYANLAPTTYQYGVGLSLSNINAYLSLGGPYDPQLVFLGWYSDMTFSTRVYSISSSSTGTVNVYAKWRYDKGYLYRTSGWNINNSDPLNQGYEYLSLGMDSSLYSELTNLGIDQVVIRFWIRIKGNGTQYVYLYNGNTRLATQEYQAPSTTEYSTFYCSFTVSLSSVQSASALQIRYQASTSWFLFFSSSHSWQTDKSFAEVAFVVDPNDLNSPEFTWHENNVLC